MLVLYLHLCAWILNRLCTARSVYVGQSYAKCGYKSTQYTYKLLICTAKMSGEDETKCVELTALEKNNESKEINQRSFAVSNKNTAGSKQDCNRKWRWIKLRPMRAGSVLDGGKSPLYKYWPYLEVALLSVVVVVVLLLMLLPTIFYHLPLPVRY